MRDIIVIALLFLLAPASSYADSIQAGDVVQLRLTDSSNQPLVRFGNGGPFRMDLPGTIADFITFCLETDEYFTPGEWLEVGSVSSNALKGGLNTDSGDPISGTTAFLYTQFRGGVSGYTDGRLMQEAIWLLEGEIAGASSAALALVSTAQQRMATLGWGLDDIGNVRVANLYRGAGFATHAQDMLVLVPEPGTLLMAALGVLWAGRGRRRAGATRTA